MAIDRLCQVVADVLDLDPGAVSDDLTPDDVENWTSLNHLRLIAAVEEALGITLTMEQIESVSSIGVLRQFTERRIR